MIVDLEATCQRDGEFNLDEMETIEIGAVMFDCATLTIVDEFQTFVKPTTKETLSEFCTELTCIKQSDVNNAPSFQEAFEALNGFAERHRAFAWASWGNYDKKQLLKDCERNSLPFRLPPHVNLKKAFRKAQKMRWELGMEKALLHVGLTPTGVAHRGIDDARNIARLAPWYLSDALPSASS